MLSVNIEPKVHFYKMCSHESSSKIGMGIRVISSSLVESAHLFTQPRLTTAMCQELLREGDGGQPSEEETCLSSSLLD